MIYLILAFLSFFTLFLVFYSIINIWLSDFYTKQKFYSSMNKNKAILILSYLVKCSDIFVPLIKILKFKIFIDYTEKLNNILKIFYFNNYIKVNAYNFIFIQFVCMLLGFIISFFMFGFDLIFVFCLGLVFLILPYLKIYEEYNKINSSIVRQIPDVANLLSIMVYSGIDFNASLNKIIKILDGYLIKELEFVTEKVSLGVDIKIAFEEMAKKYNLLQLNTFVKAINMSLDTGTGLCDSLSKISEQINKDNVSVAEKKAHEAPIKMLIPMTLLVLPTIFILLFAPFVLSFLKSGSIF